MGGTKLFWAVLHCTGLAFDLLGLLGFVGLAWVCWACLGLLGFLVSSGLAVVCWVGWGLCLLFLFSDGRVLDLAGTTSQPRMEAFAGNSRP